LHTTGYLICARREIQDRADARSRHRVDRRLRRGGGHGDHRDPDGFALDDAAYILEVVDQHAPARAPPDLLLQRIEQRDNLEAVVSEAGVIRERETEIAGAHDRDAHPAIEPEDLPEMAPQFLDVVADPADPQLAEVRKVLPDLRGVEVKLLGERVR